MWRRYSPRRGASASTLRARRRLSTQPTVAPYATWSRICGSQRQGADARIAPADDAEVERRDREPAGDAARELAPPRHVAASTIAQPNDIAPCATSAAGSRRDMRSSRGKISVPAASDASSGLIRDAERVQRRRHAAEHVREGPGDDRVLDILAIEHARGTLEQTSTRQIEQVQGERATATIKSRPTERGNFCMKIKLVSLEDGITSCGFRKMAAYVARINEDTESCYISTKRYRSIRNGLRGTLGSAGSLEPEEIDLAARGLIKSDLVGFSSMTGYADLTRKLIKPRARARPVDVHHLGRHPPDHPARGRDPRDVDAICIGEGEFAFEELCDGLKAGKRPTDMKNFWFKDGKGGEEIIKNHFLPLMSQARWSRCRSRSTARARRSTTRARASCR